MKIEKLVIYGFGKHENLTIEADPQLSVFYGTNEAGKTTIQQFIIQTLFGYPARNQSLLRYEPKSGGRFGGQVHIDDTEYGKVIIERVNGKSAGDVTVYFEEGRRGSEAELKMILRDYDRASFESVFSFSIHELQGLERMTEEELSRTLLASGTTGVDTVTKMEAGLEKEMAVLFKKTGRNPEMNVLIEELRNEEKELKEMREQTQLYGPYIERIREIDKQLAVLTEEEESISRDMAMLGKWRQAAPLAEKKEQLEKLIEALTVQDFPADGRRRMDLLQDRLSDTKAKMVHIEKELSAIPLNEGEPGDGEQFENLLAKESEWHRLRSVLRQKQEEMEKLEDDQERLLNLIGMSEEEALNNDVSLNREEQLVTLVQDCDIEEEEQRFRNRSLQEEKNALNDAARELALAKNHMPTEEERSAAESWPAIRAELAAVKARKQLQKKNSSKTLPFLLIGLGLIGFIAGLLQKDFLLAGLAFAAAAGGAWIIIKENREMPADQKSEELLKKYDGRETEFEALVRKVEKYRSSILELERLTELKQKKIRELSEDISESPAKKRYEAFLEEIGLDRAASRTTVLDLFEKLREVHAVHSRLKKSSEQAGRLKAEIAVWLEEARRLCDKPLSADDMYNVLRSEYKLRQKRRDNQLRNLEKSIELDTEKKRLAALLEQLISEQESLLNEAGAESIGEYYRLCEDWNRKEQLERELAPVMSQLQAVGEAVMPDGLSPDSVDDYRAEKEAGLADLKEQRNRLLAESAEKQQAVKQLLSDGSYDEKLQLFEEKKAMFNDLARQWSVDKAITEAIRRTMEDLKEKLLPEVIDSAQLYFEKLTAGSYQGLAMSPDGFFEAVRKDGIRFHIAELSQATKEQAYVALRLALAVSMQSSHPFPIIMDDPFVHFDRGRLKQMINLVTELKKEHQFLYFTCHEEMKQAWPAARIIDVANTGRSVYS